MVELAVCLPVLVLIVIATIEACTMLFVSQSLKVTAYEGARVGIVPTSKKENVIFQCETILKDRGVKDFSVTMNPADPDSLVAGDYFEVTVSAGYDANSLLNGWMYAGNTIVRTTALRAE
ncbi:MAG: TadE family protein [Planctomycetota bacterium]